MKYNQIANELKKGSLAELNQFESRENVYSLYSVQMMHLFQQRVLDSGLPVTKPTASCGTEILAG